MTGVLPDTDLACAIALGFVEHPRLIVNRLQITVLDHRGQPVENHPGWLSTFDKLHQIVADFLAARDEATKANARTGYGNAGVGAAAQVKSREAANTKAIHLKSTARAMLAERGVIAKAKTLGLSCYF